ncbi:hypothetical protein H4R21_000882, partial [Coemansia helicoidea]
MERERTGWAVERAQLKARISAAERRTAQAESKLRAAQMHITALECLLQEEKAQGQAASAVDGDSQPGIAADAPAPPTVAEVVSATRDTRERSRALLRRCLEELDALAAPCLADDPLPQLAASPADARPASATLPTEQPPPHKLNGIIESDSADRAAGADERLSLVSSQMPIRAEAAEQQSQSLPTKRPLKSVALRRRRLSQMQHASPPAASSPAPAPATGRPSSADEKRPPAALFGEREMSWSQDMGDGVRRLAVDEVDAARRSGVPA